MHIGPPSVQNRRDWSVSVAMAARGRIAQLGRAQPHIEVKIVDPLTGVKLVVRESAPFR